MQGFNFPTPPQPDYQAHDPQGEYAKGPQQTDTAVKPKTTADKNDTPVDADKLAGRYATRDTRPGKLGRKLQTTKGYM